MNSKFDAINAAKAIALATGAEQRVVYRGVDSLTGWDVVPVNESRQFARLYATVKPNGEVERYDGALARPRYV